MSLRSRIVGGGGYIVRIKTRQETTDDILSVRDTFLVLSSRDFLRAASFALFASISARRRSARDGAEDILPKVTRYAGIRYLLKERHPLFVHDSLSEGRFDPWPFCLTKFYFRLAILRTYKNM